MIRRGIIIGLFVSVCLLSNSAADGSQLSLSPCQDPLTCSLGVPTIFSNFCEEDFIEERNIRMALRACLEAVSKKEGRPDLERLAELTWEHKSVLFDGVHFFFNEPSVEIPVNIKLSKKEHCVMCRTASSKDDMPKTYYVVFELTADEKGEFPAKIYSEDMWNKPEDAGEDHVAALRAGKSLSPPSVSRKYTLFISADIFRDSSEYDDDMKEYSSRFNLEAVDSNRSVRSYIERIIDIFVANPKLDPRMAIVQLPPEFIQKKYWPIIDELVEKAPGIRFMIMDITELRSSLARGSLRKAMYAGMLLTRKIGEEMERKPELGAFFEQYFGILSGDKEESAKAMARRCMAALERGDTNMFKSILFVPAENKELVEENEELTDCLIFA